MLKHRITAVILFAVLAVLLLPGCTRIKFTTGLSKGEIVAQPECVPSTQSEQMFIPTMYFSSPAGLTGAGT